MVRPTSSARTGAGTSATSWNSAALRPSEGLIPSWTSWARMFSVLRCWPGLPPGEQPLGAAGGVQALASMLEMLPDEVIDDRWHLYRGGAEGDVDPASTIGDLVDAGGHDPCQGLREQQGEQAADPGVSADRRVVQQLVHDRPPVLLAHPDLRLGAGDVRDLQGSVDPGVAQPRDEAALVLQWTARVPLELLQNPLGG